MSDIMPKNEGVDKTAAKRAAYSRGFLESVGKSAADLAEELKKKPFEIIIDPADDKSLTMGIAQLQKKLGFPEEDHAKGCDGKFGPYTKRVYEGFGVGKKAGTERGGMMEDVGTGGGDVVASGSSYSTPGESVDKPVDSKLEPVKISETVFVGDSLTVGMARAKGLDQCINLYKGGSSTNSRLPVLKKFLEDNQSNITNGKIKRVVITLGTNDITNCRGKKDSISSIIDRLETMFQTVTSRGLSLVLNTIPYSDLGKRLNYWRNVHGDQYLHKLKSSVTANELAELKQLHGENNHYELALAILKLKVDKVNAFIKSKAGGIVGVVDVYEATRDQNIYPLGADGLHFTPKGSRAMATLIKERGRITND